MLYYVAGAMALAIGFYQYSKPDYWEFAMYFSAGMAFITTALSMKPWDDILIKRALVISSWVFIAIAVFLFLYLMRTDF